MVYDLALEVGRGDDWQPAEDVRLESGDVIGRIRTVFADREYRYSGSNPQVFIEGANGDCLSARAPRLPAFGRVVVVCTAAFVDEILTFATRITQTPALPNGDVRVLPLMERFKLLNALSFHFSSKATENTSLPLCLSRFSLFGRFHVRLVGGLAFENSFLPGALPLVEALWEGTGKAPAVYCDEMELKGVQRQDRLEYDLPEAANKIGLHIVSAADGSRLAFNVAAPMRRYESSDPDDAPNVAMYFGPEFLRWVRSAREIKLARKQSGGENATAFLLQGARIFEKDARSQN